MTHRGQLDAGIAPPAEPAEPLAQTSAPSEEEKEVGGVRWADVGDELGGF